MNTFTSASPWHRALRLLTMPVAALPRPHFREACTKPPTRSDQEHYLMCPWLVKGRDLELPLQSDVRYRQD